MTLLEAIIFGLPTICGNCHKEVQSTDLMGLCRECRKEYNRQHRTRKAKAVKR